MSFTTEQLTQICKEALHIAHEVLSSLTDKGTSEVHDKYVTDISTKGDRAVSDALIAFFKEQKIPAILYSEEYGRIELMEDPKLMIVFDDIDGTNNYNRGRGILPYTTVVTIFDSTEPNFEDALIAGIIEHNSGNLWHAVRNGGCYLNDVRTKTSGRRILDRRTLVTIDHYISCKDISKFLDVYPESWVKDFGSTALHYAGISSGMIDAHLSTLQKAHDLGAGFLLVKEAGGFIADLDGKPFDKVRYDFDAQYPIIAASTQELGKILLSKLK